MDIIDPLNKYTPYIRAVQSGMIIHDTIAGYGLIATIEHSKYRKTRYAHLQQFVVKDSSMVKKGEPIALMGNTGHSKSKHLHYEMFERTDTTKSFKPVNPFSEKVIYFNICPFRRCRDWL